MTPSLFRAGDLVRILPENGYGPLFQDVEGTVIESRTEFSARDGHRTSVSVWVPRRPYGAGMFLFFEDELDAVIE